MCCDERKGIVGELMADPIKDKKFFQFFLIDIDGKEYEIKPSEKDLEEIPVLKKREIPYKLMKLFIQNELFHKKGGKEPSHIKNMKSLQLVDYCPESDISHYKWYPNGELIKDLLLDYALFKIALPWGAMKIRNPLLYRKDVEEIRNLQGEFHERGYEMEVDQKPFVLRFASDPGAFPFAKRMFFSYKDMPVKIYEEAICFRKEQSGEVVGLFRVRNFLMTDHHAFCADEEQAMEEYLKLSKLFSTLMDSLLGQYWILGFEAVKEFYEKYKESIFKRVVKESSKPAFIKIMKEMKHYFAFKSEYQFVSPGGQNIQMSTVQWDVKNGARFKIEYVNADGKKIPVPIILHASSLGSIERTLAALLEKAEWERLDGKLPSLPLWLSPEQVRILPVSEKYLPYSEEIAKHLKEYGIRVSIDDRNITLPKKVAESRRQWIPYIVVVGEKEVKTQKLSVTVRSKSTSNQNYTETLSVEELAKEIRKEISNYPFRPLYISEYLSRRPIFK